MARRKAKRSIRECSNALQCQLIRYNGQGLLYLEVGAQIFSQYDIPQELVANGDETSVSLVGFTRQGHLIRDSYQEPLVVRIHRRH